MEFFNFLAEEQPTSSWPSMIIIIVLIAVLLIMVILSGRSQRKRQKQMMEMNMKLKPGDRIKSIGGIVGTIEEITDRETFIIRTGDHLMEIDRQAVYAMDEITAPAVEESEPEKDAADEESAAESQPEPESEESDPQDGEVKH